MMSLRDQIRNRQFEKRPNDQLLGCLEDEQLREWFADPVKEHYQLLGWISRGLDGVTLYDIGTYRGLSALALAENSNNTVISYDIKDLLMLKDPPTNIEFKIGDFFKDAGILESAVIMFDVDPHDGEIEQKTIDWLTENDYSGTVIFDDIWLNGRMQNFWRNIKQEKHDLTSYGHWSGTGVVFF